MAGRHDYHWTFGNGAHISFPGGGAPVVGPPHGFTSNEGCATFSDGGGNLLFYTDGRILYEAGNNPINPLPNPPLGGTSSSAHSVIIVPPAGGGSLYHIFATSDWEGVGQPNVGPVTYTPVAVGAGVSIVAPPAQLAFGPQRSSEKLAAVPHMDCNKYWVASLHVDTTQPPGPGRFYAMLIDSDAGPTAANTVSQPYPYANAAHGGYCMKFSPNGNLLALTSLRSLEIFNFNRATGAISPHSQITGFSAANAVYGLEFSPDSQIVYFTGIKAGYINRHQISVGSTTFSSTDQVGQWLTAGVGNNRVGALQLAPNGKIYGVKVSQNTLFEIGDPNNPSPAAAQFNPIATQAGGGQLTLNAIAVIGLPTFTRIADDCADQCRNLAAAIDAQLIDQLKQLKNGMLTCRGEDPGNVDCAPLDIPPIGPKTYISWGDSKCDCIEGDDTEIMYLTVCNPYSNLTLSNVTVYELVVVDDNGVAVPNLPNGDPSIQLVPVGPYCFDDIAPCACVTREFVLRLRGAPGGRYRILVRGICFDACFHGDTEACFAFDVCED